MFSQGLRRVDGLKYGSILKLGLWIDPRLCLSRLNPGTEVTQYNPSTKRNGSSPAISPPTCGCRGGKGAAQLHLWGSKENFGVRHWVRLVVSI